LLITDTLKHRLCLYSVGNLKELKIQEVNQNDDLNGPYEVCLTEDNLIIYKNDLNSQLIVTDIGLDPKEKILLSKLKSNFSCFTYLNNDINSVLVVYTSNPFNRFITYT